MRENNSRALTESAVFTGLGVVLSYLIAYLPITFMIPFLLLPLLPLLLSERHGVKYGVMMSISMVLIILLLDPMQLMFDVPCLIIGISFGIGIHRGMKPLKNLGMTWIISTVVMMGIFWLIGQFFGYNPIEQIFEQMRIANETVKGMGMQTIDMETMITTMSRAVVGILAGSTLLLCVSVIFMGKFILRRLKITTLDGYFLTDFMITREGLAGIFTVVVILYLLRVFGLVFVDSIMYNLATIIMLLMMFSGLCSFNAIMRFYRIGKPVRMVIFLVSFMMLSQFMVIFGLLDSIFEIRKKITVRTERM